MHDPTLINQSETSSFHTLMSSQAGPNVLAVRKPYTAAEPILETNEDNVRESRFSQVFMGDRQGMGQWYKQVRLGVCGHRFTRRELANAISNSTDDKIFNHEYDEQG